PQLVAGRDAGLLAGAQRHRARPRLRRLELDALLAHLARHATASGGLGSLKRDGVFSPSRSNCAAPKPPAAAGAEIAASRNDNRNSSAMDGRPPGSTSAAEGGTVNSVTLQVNGASETRSVEPRVLLVHFLRDVLGLTGTHVGCDTSQCGACTVLLDGAAVK